MAVHRKAVALMDPIEAVARLAASAQARAESAQTRASGSASYDNADGTRTVIGPQAGSATMATHVGDVTPPPVPTGIRAWSGDGNLHVLWAGSLDGDVPADFDHVTILVDGLPVAEMRSAGSVTVDGLAVGSTVSVTATAEDDACLADGTPVHNVSAPSTALSVEIRDVMAEARADIDAFKASAEATYSTKTEVDEKTKAVTESIEAAYLKKDDASTTYATKMELSKSADGIRSEVSEEYVTKDDADKAYVGKSSFEQDSRKIATTVTSELTTGWTAWADDSTGKNMVLSNTYPGAKTAPGGTEHPVDVDNMAFIGSAKVLSSEQPTSAASYDWIPNSTKAMRTRIEQTSDRVDTAIMDIGGISTLIRQDATGITVGKSADGKTYSTGRTRMTADAFQVLDKAGTVITQMAKDGASFLAGLVKIVVGTGTLPGNKTTNFIRVDAGSGVAGLSGIISRLDATIEGITSSLSAGWEQDFGYGVTAIVRESDTVASAAYLAPDKCELHVGDNHVTMTPDAIVPSKPSALRAAVGSYGPVSPSSPYGSLTFCVRAGVATLWVSWGTSADAWATMRCGDWVVPEEYRPKFDLWCPVALESRGSGDTGDTTLIVEASTGVIRWSNRGGGHSVTRFNALVSWGIE